MRIISGGFVKDSRSVSDAGVEVAGDPVDEIETGKRLVRVGGDRGISLAERIASQLRLLAWRSPLHRLRLRGRFPLKLITVPTDPIAGDAAVGEVMMQGHFVHRGESVAKIGRASCRERVCQYG